MGNNTLNTLSTCSVAFLSVGAFSFIVYAALILFSNTSLNEQDILNLQYKTMHIRILKMVSLGFGVVFTFGSFLCSLLNRTNAVPGQSKDNWNNGLFFSGISIIFCAIMITFKMWSDNTLQETRMALASIILFSVGSWLILAPDLMPKECTPT